MGLLLGSVLDLTTSAHSCVYTMQGKAAYQYVEVMSCPSGCNNGGGQIPAAEVGKAAATALLGNVRRPQKPSSALVFWLLLSVCYCLLFLVSVCLSVCLVSRVWCLFPFRFLWMMIQL